MAKPKISNEDLCRNAKRLKTGVAEIKTFLAVETKNKGFDAQDRPLILFERHWFHKLTKGKHDATHPNISSRSAGGYGSSASQYSRFSIAFNLNPVAAMKSTSWGLGQVMGFNHKVAGYDSVNEFVDAMKESEGKQLDAAISFIIHNNLADELRNHNWAGFAKGYNGRAYRKNKYDTKLASFYAKFSKETEPNCGTLLKKTVNVKPINVEENDTSLSNPFEDTQTNISLEETYVVDTATEESETVNDGQIEGVAKAEEPAPDVPAQEGEAIVVGRPQDPSIEITKNEVEKATGWKTWPTTITATLGGMGLSAGGIITQVTGAEFTPQTQSLIGWLVIIGLIMAAGYVLFYLISRMVHSGREAQRAHEIDLKEMELRSMPDRYNVTLGK